MSTVAYTPRASILRPLIVDRYLLRQFVQSFLICFISLTGLFVIIDGFANLEEFISYAQKHGNLFAVMGRYYAFQSLLFFDITSHLITLIAAMFTVTWIQRHNEMTALESAGVSRFRVIQPIVMAVMAISVLAAANRELILPLCRSQLSHNAQNLGGSSGKKLTPRYDNETGLLLGGAGAKTYADELRINKPDFNLPAGLDRYGPQLAAENAYYLRPEGTRPGGYLFREVKQPSGLDQLHSLALGERVIVFTPRDQAWLKPGECFVASNVSFEHLESTDNLTQLSSTAELISGLRNRSLDFGAGERMAIHARVVRPVLDVTLLFLGLPLVLSRTNRNVFFAIGLCMILVVAFMLVVFGCQYLGKMYWIEPSLAAWLPVLVFVPVAVALSQPLYE